jgi:uncharacterized protein YaaR (DUF327 family)
VLSNLLNILGDTMQIREGSTTRKIDIKSTGSSSASKSLVQTLFSTEMLTEERKINDYEHEIDELRKEVGTAGDNLEKEPTIPNFKHFRDILSKLAKRISTEAYRLEKCGGTPQNPRYFEIITTINVEADKLYNLVVREQKNNMAITEKVIGIKGLVVDLIT